MRIITEPIDIYVLENMLGQYYDDMLKAVVDVKKEVIAVNADMHADLERELLDTGSRQWDLWGINIFPRAEKDEGIVFDSLINIRPNQNNRSRAVENLDVRKKILEIINKKIKWK
ncbi:MAG: DUF5674 family protein [Elusimicrobium sp.]|jgi:hypothetical protein|nr:DUF5674 family protein [Elusimicrobium sp.]